jgi:hypothetical protein
MAALRFEPGRDGAVTSLKPSTQGYGPFVAAGLIMVLTVAGWFAMPRIMLLVSGGGPFVGMAVAILFMLSFFFVLWLRARHQQHKNRD